mmetsp:Transcript_53810/g.112359  ORF Transcript_53810/g.112359 Transcript_53810/m.112359 type:complete len:233 (+) Transcript_53810:1265-1963(+)
MGSSRDHPHPGRGGRCYSPDLLLLHHLGPVGRLHYRFHHGVLHFPLVPAGARCCALHRDWRCHEHHLRPCPRLPVCHHPGGPAVCHHVHLPQVCWDVRGCPCRARHAFHAGHLPCHRRLRTHLGQCGRYRRDGGAAVERARQDGRPRRCRQHDCRDWKGLRHRLGRARVARALRRFHHPHLGSHEPGFRLEYQGREPSLPDCVRIRPVRCHGPLLVLCADHALRRRGGPCHG